jgi:starvation-inducible outer membrane lipoprotein
VPPAIRGDTAEGALNPVSVEQVQRDAESYRGQRVRWGGSIIAVRNLPQSTEIEVYPGRWTAMANHARTPTAPGGSSHGCRASSTRPSMQKTGC